MQKFGLQRNAKSLNNAIELEIAREQASSLGRAGRKLRLSLERYEQARHTNLCTSDQQKAFTEIANNAWELILQREFIGFVEGNISWVTDNYSIPEQALAMLGQQR